MLLGFNCFKNSRYSLVLVGCRTTVILLFLALVLAAALLFLALVLAAAFPLLVIVISWIYIYVGSRTDTSSITESYVPS